MPLPSARAWVNGEDPASLPSADDLNLDWRDSFDFLLGYSRPFIYVQSNVAQNLVAGTFQNINWQVEMVKRGGMVHSANSASIVVPYTGQYVGFGQLGVGSMASTGTKLTVVIQVNAVTNFARWDQGPPTTAGMEIAGSFTLDLVANDAVTFFVRSSGVAVSTSTSALNRSRMALWYQGDGA